MIGSARDKTKGRSNGKTEQEKFLGEEENAAHLDCKRETSA